MSWLWGAEDDESGHARRTRRPRRGSAARSLLALLAVAAVLGAGVLGVVALLRSIEPSAPEATLTCSAGSELLLVSGSAQVVNANAVSDVTAGAAMAAQADLAANHLYLVTAAGIAVTAANDVTVMVRGTATVA